jgi:hypothetical protein
MRLVEWLQKYHSDSSLTNYKAHKQSLLQGRGRGDNSQSWAWEPGGVQFSLLAPVSLLTDKRILPSLTVCTIHGKVLWEAQKFFHTVSIWHLKTPPPLMAHYIYNSTQNLWALGPDKQVAGHSLTLNLLSLLPGGAVSTEWEKCF